METGGWPRRSRTVRVQRRTPAPRPSSTHLVGLAADCDPLGPHLILLNRRWIAVGRDVLPDGDDLIVAPRLLMREMGASVTVQTLSLSRTMIVACGFSNFEMRIGPVTVTSIVAAQP